MTDDEIKEIVRDYIISGYESDNADCLHENDAWYKEPFNTEYLQRGYDFYRKAKVTVTWE